MDAEGLSGAPATIEQARPELALIAAVARNGVIGADNRLPWSLPSDLRHFRALTMGKPVLMGRHTFASIGGPLPGRFVVVLSRDDDFAPPGVTVARSIEEAIGAGEALAREHGAPEIMVAGGGFVYAALIGRARRLYVTEVDCTPDGDTVFPPIDEAAWRETDRSPRDKGPRDSVAFSFVTYERR